MSQRLRGLDILRAIAVILVLFRHSGLQGSVLYDFGWLGVDLFFVLSGYLISTLLIKEYQAKKSVNVKRFFVRRGFKIYPAFYVFLIFTLLFEYFDKGRLFDTVQIVSETFYLQSYLPHISLHSWSLAVEEHFYIVTGLIVWLILISKLRISTKSALIYLSLTLVFCFGLRFLESYPHREEAFHTFLQSHLRADGIVVGIIVAFFLQTNGARKVVMKYRWLFAIVAVGLVLPGFFYKSASYFMNTAGLSLVNMGFGILVLLAVVLSKAWRDVVLGIWKWPLSLISLIGVHSYSIYLWHLMTQKIIYRNLDFNEYVMTGFYILIACSIGILLSLLIEQTFLGIRDKYWPRA